jgi:hypothetical protein
LTRPLQQPASLECVRCLLCRGLPQPPGRYTPIAPNPSGSPSPAARAKPGSSKASADKRLKEREKYHDDPEKKELLEKAKKEVGTMIE